MIYKKYTSRIIPIIIRILIHFMLCIEFHIARKQTKFC
jgi:hypothetical protein